VGSDSLFAEFRRVVDQQVDDYVTRRGLEEDAHGGFEELRAASGGVLSYGASRSSVRIVVRSLVVVE
jgi:hypothetical protein